MKSKKTKNIIRFSSVLLFAIIISNGIFSQVLHYNADTVLREGDSVKIIMSNSYRGQLQWQKSDDRETWTDIPDENIDTLSFNIDTTNYYRAMIQEGTCDPIYSDTTKICMIDTLLICGADTIIISLQGYQFGTVSWESSADGLLWNSIDNAHDTIYKCYPAESMYYNAINKLTGENSVLSDVVFIQKLPVADAGIDRIVNENSVFLSANHIVGCSGLWTIISGEGGNFSSMEDPKAQFTGNDTLYVIEWTLNNSCGSSKDTINIEFTENEYIEAIAIVDSTDILLSDSIQLSEGLYIIDFSDPAPIITDTTVMLGLINDGFIRRVDSSYMVSDTFFIYTSQGTLADITISGVYDIGQALDFDTTESKLRGYKRLDHLPTRKELSEKSEYSSGVYYYLVEDEPVYTYPGVSYNFTQSKNSDSEILLTFNNTIVSNSNASVELNGYYFFKPNFISELDYEFPNVNTFKMGIYNGVIERNYEIRFHASTATNIIDTEFTLFSFSKNIIFIIGGVPIWIKAQLDMNGNVSANAEDSMDISHEYTKTSTYTAALEYYNNSLHSIYNKNQNVEVDNSFVVQGNLTQNFEIGHEITFKIFGIVGPYIDTKLSEELDLCFCDTNWQADLDIGGQIAIGAKAEALGITLFDFNKTFQHGFYSLEVPNKLEMISGNNQNYTTGQTLSNQLKVKARSNKGYAVPDVHVKFETQNGGSVGNLSVMTNSNGEATTTWTPGGSGTSYLNAYVLDCNGNHLVNSPRVFTAYNTSAGNDCSQSSLSASVEISGNTIYPQGQMGNPPYEYSTDGTNYSSSVPQITTIAGQHYNFYVIDEDGCEAMTAYTAASDICNNTNLDADVFVQGNIIEVAASGGNPPYQFSLDNASEGYTSYDVFTDVSLGVHQIYVKDEDGCLASENVLVEDVIGPVLANFQVNYALILPSTTVQFIDISSNNPTGWNWDFGDGDTSSFQNPSHTYSTEGIYTISLIVTNNYSSDTETPRLII